MLPSRPALLFGGALLAAAVVFTYGGVRTLREPRWWLVDVQETLPYERYSQPSDAAVTVARIAGAVSLLTGATAALVLVALTLNWLVPR